MFVSILLFIVIFCVLVVSHEFGHFITAKKNGIHVVEFFVGVGPALFSREKNGTKYSIRLLPLGGACVFETEDGLEKENAEGSGRAFASAPVFSRIATVLAGPIFNFIVAYLIALIIVFLCGVSLPVVDSVMEGGGAQAAGLRAGDVITRMNRSRIHLQDEISFYSLVNRNGESFTIEYKRDGKTYETTVIPTYDEEEGRYYIGITSGQFLQCNLPQTFRYAYYTVGYFAKTTFKGLAMLVQGQLQREDVSSPIGMVKMVDDTYDVARNYGVSSVILSMLNITLLLSVSLGIMNLLPLPALDGGRLVFLLIEVVRGKPVPPEKEGMVHLAGMLCLVVIMVLAMANDITKFF